MSRQVRYDLAELETLTLRAVKLSPQSTDAMPLITERRRSITQVLSLGEIYRRQQSADLDRELASAVHWFFEQYGFLPTTLEVSAAKYFLLGPGDRDFYPVHCEDIGCFTVGVRSRTFGNWVRCECAVGGVVVVVGIFYL